jgi:hypothetical protein
MDIPNHLPGAERFLKSAQDRNGRGQSRAEKTIAKADEISIYVVLKDFLSLDIPITPEGSSWKTYCPWRHEHPDGGLDKGFRVYPDSNSAMCFPMHGYLTPSRVIAVHFSERPLSAAERLLRHYGMLKEAPWWERFTDLAREREQSNMTINPAYAVATLHSVLRSKTNYATLQYSASVREGMAQVLRDLDGAVEKARANPHIAEQALKGWLENSVAWLIAMTDLSEVPQIPENKKENSHDQA